jgi:excisionase family DNA binding protein
MSSSYLGTRDAASYLSLSADTMERMRLRGDGPAFARVGDRRIVYRREDLDAWVAARVVTSTSEARR